MAVEAAKLTLAKDRVDLKQLSLLLREILAAGVISMRDYKQVTDTIGSVVIRINKQELQINTNISVIATMRSKLNSGHREAEQKLNTLKVTAKVIPWTKKS